MKNGKLAYLVLCAMLVACVSRNGKHHAGTALRPANGGKTYGGTFRLNMVRGSPNALDPIKIVSKVGDDLALQIFDRLITFDSTLQVKGELARSWDISPDGRIYTFHLRTNVRFHDDPCFPGGRGRLLTAKDFVYSFTRCCDPTSGSLTYWAFKERVVGVDRYHAERATNPAATLPEGFQAPDDSTFIVRLVEPQAPFLLVLANGLGCPVPREAIEHYGKDIFRHPVGTGPFRLTKWEEDRVIVLDRNAGYWQTDEHGNRLPYLDRIEVSFIKDDNVQFSAFRQGDLDENFTIPTEVFPVLVEPGTGKLQGRFAQFQLQRIPALCTWFVDFQCTKAPFDDRRVRRALALSVDRHRIVRYVLQGSPWGAANHGITPPVLPDYPIDDIPGIGFDPEAARRELAAAGYPNGQGFPAIEMTIYPEPRLKQTAEALQQMWKEHLGVNIGIRMLNFAQFLEQTESGTLPMWGTRWYGDYPDPETFLGLYNGALLPADPTAPSYPNSVRYDDAEVTSLIKRAMMEPAADLRHDLYRQAERKLTQDAPSVMLFYEMHYRLLQPWVRGYALDPMARNVLKHAYFVGAS